MTKNGSRKKKSRTNKEAESFFAEIFESIADGITILKPDLTISYTNKTVENWHPYALPLVGKKCFEVFHGRDSQCEGCPTKPVLEKAKRGFSIVPRHNQKREIIGWLSIHTFPIFDKKTGKIKAIIEHVREITELKKAEEELRKFKLIADTANYGMAITDMKGEISYINRYFAEIHGYKVEELIGKSFSVLHNREQMKKVEELFQLMQEEGEFSTVEVWHKRKNGTIFPMLVNGTLIRDENGIPSFMAIMGVDITSLKEAERLMRIKDASIEASINAIFITDLNGNLTYVNRAFLKMWGYDEAKEILGKKAVTLFQNQKEAEKVVMVIRKKGVWTGDMVARRKNGESFDVLSSATVVIGDDLKPICIIASFIDITQRKKTEQMLKHQAIHDALTGLYNHRYIMDRLKIEFASARRYKNPLSICLCDLDLFKNVNDKYGHDIGDEVLVRFAHILATHLRKENISARYGGDEFLILFPHTPAEKAAIALERIRNIFENELFRTAKGETFVVTASFGLTDLLPEHSRYQEFFKAADQALYQAKNTGRNKVVIQS